MTTTRGCGFYEYNKYSIEHHPCKEYEFLSRAKGTYKGISKQQEISFEQKRKVMLQACIQKCLPISQDTICDRYKNTK